MPSPYAEKGEVPFHTKIFRSFKGVVNNSARNALPEEAWYYLENLQPIGDANLQTVANISGPLWNFGSHSIYWMQYANIGGTDYMMCFATDGTVWAYSIGAGSASQIGSGFSGSGSRFAQWKNTVLLAIDSTGYYAWTGSGSLTAITGTGVPTAGTDIAVGFGRVWVLNGRLLTGSAPDAYVATAWTVANGAFTVNLTDPLIRKAVTRLQFQNGYLYLVAPTAVNAISDVYVPASASPPTPLFTNLNIQPIIGSDEAGSVFGFNQALVFANHFGIWELYGTNAKKVSTDIDGTWQYIDFSQVISGGQFVSNNILGHAMLFKRSGDPVLGNATVLACYFNEKWWFANFGPLTFVASGIIHDGSQVDGEPTLFGILGNNMVQLFADSTGSPASTAVTALWPMEDQLADKQVIRAGFEAALQTPVGSFSMTIDGTNNVKQSLPLNPIAETLVFVNNQGQPLQFVNNMGLPLYWSAGTYILYNGSSPAAYAKYVGATIKGAGSFQLSSINMDYKLRARWS